jgi:hypothetical protein
MKLVTHLKPSYDSEFTGQIRPDVRIELESGAVIFTLVVDDDDSEDRELHLNAADLAKALELLEANQPAKETA